MSVVYRDYMQPENQETRDWFEDCLRSDRVVAWGGEHYRLNQIQKIRFDRPRVLKPDQFIVFGSMVP
jgi:hypothetical protein